MSKNLKTLKALRDLGEERIQELRQYRKDGIPVVGYLDIFTPPELIASCGAIPLGLQLGGDYDAELAGEKYMKSDACAFCKACIGYKATKHPLYDCVTHLVGANTCDQMRRMQELWHKYFHIPVYVFNIPYTWQEDEASQLFGREMSWLKSELEALCGTKMDIGKLRSLVEKHNTARRLLEEINRLRREQVPRVSGCEVLELAYYYWILDIDTYNSCLLDLIKEIEAREPRARKHEKRILFGGSILAHGDHRVLGLIEERGATVTGDFLYNVQSTFIDEIDTVGDIWKNLCESYRLKKVFGNSRPNCRIYEFAKNEAEKCKADAVIYKTLKFCDPWTAEVFRMKRDLGLPFLHFDSTYSPSGEGQLITRIEAFLEILGKGKLWK